MLDKRYFITADNQLKIQTDFLSSLSAALKQPWPPQLAQRSAQLLPDNGPLLQRFYRAHQLLIHGDADSLTRASAQLSELIKSAPNFHYLLAEKALVDLLRNSYQPFDSRAPAQLRADISHLATIPN